MMRLLLPGLLLLAGLTAACGAGGQHASSVSDGTPAPNVSWQWLEGTTDETAGSLAEMRGRVVLLEFWRTW